MDITAPVLTGRWVRLEPFAEEHRAGLRAAGDDDRVWQFMPVNGRGPEFDRVFDDALAHRAAGKRLPYAVRLLATEELIGATSYIEPIPLHKRVEIGWTWYRPDQWAGAVNPECKFLLLAHAFEALGLNRVQLVTDLLNTRSQAAIAKLGATREGVLRAHAITRGGRIRDTVVFSITAPEWPQVKERLAARLATFEANGRREPAGGADSQ
ncbi:GNAT family N-acetyltransferase [Frigoriglobus tundricola]|uniref:Acetyltransferase, GNAT family n=1 Tax=Frigoriglobus tundricola TaxID=2774151 RepID=A0A6M5YS32_9BACT|nr:GNAT family protein [Frigoriglobus tundricola]QJW95792.1 Acetyltransferase, GNAT family [Frigoriglobus tundricola]